MSYIIHLATQQLVNDKNAGKKLKKYSRKKTKKQIKQALKRACRMLYNHRRKIFLVTMLFVLRPTPVWAEESISYYVALIQEADLLLEMMEFRSYLKMVEVRQIMRELYGTEFSAWDDLWPFFKNTVWPFLRSPSSAPKLSFVTMVVCLFGASIITRTSPIVILKMACHQLVTTDAKN